MVFGLVLSAGYLGIMRIVMLSLIDDPFDPPGGGRYGGGHLFVLDLGRYLVRNGHRLTFLTRLNEPSKPLHEALGPRCDIYRIRVGPEADINPTDLAPWLRPLTEQTMEIVRSTGPFDVLHSHYWISGIVARELVEHYPTFHVHSLLSLGRIRYEVKEQRYTHDDERDQAEVKIFREADRLIACCPAELNDLKRLYPEVSSAHCYVIPYGVDTDVFFPRPESPSDFVHRAANRFKKGSPDFP